MLNVQWCKSQTKPDLNAVNARVNVREEFPVFTQIDILYELT